MTNDDTLNLLAGETERLSKFVEGLDRKSLNGPTNLEVKWKELSTILVIKLHLIEFFYYRRLNSPQLTLIIHYINIFAHHIYGAAIV